MHGSRVSSQHCILGLHVFIYNLMFVLFVLTIVQYKLNEFVHSGGYACCTTFAVLFE